MQIASEFRPSPLMFFSVYGTTRARGMLQRQWCEIDAVDHTAVPAEFPSVLPALSRQEWARTTIQSLMGPGRHGYPGEDQEYLLLLHPSHYCTVL
ncbi:hypothetical protein AZE42_13381 [Rhizopogon vesiculosus]|uniref:Uncharacterized protein n=1 Tax=Rhizopogon vesiculosus TaxID=180088 RepID=A0A1J8QFV0_9AGAM|nr:hypothetical protein AZE42_13381 [Rhizopogon vesiculosus]